MTTLILTVAGADRPGLVSAIADLVDAHGGNWENSRLAELAGTFAGVIQITVADDRAGELQAALRSLDGMLALTVTTGSDHAETDADRLVSVTVLGDDRPGIVREISGVLSSHALSIRSMTTETRDAAMAGGRLFESAVTATVPASADLDVLRADIEELTHDLQVDISVL
ncbi:glycine cleavage system regulatory protein [Microbacterium sp. W4I4]|uniref:glycine cleavage system protein R n=1 Tax=Microbacterium sp. W4I4 TaxID=3042295 RepID=UPI002780B8EC|nr:ACT domain-containing protein [Microbacterium sp. W4I4]MDQ0615035.1 glycine cleavage system regulatory protein [Microbacterium sp. W4I4]